MMRFKFHITAILALVLLCLFQGGNLLGQGDETRDDQVELIKFDKEAWEKAKEGINYSPDKKEREEKKKADQNDNTDRNRDFDGPNFDGLGSGVGTIFKLIAFIILGLLLFFIVYKLIGGDNRVSNTRIKDDQSHINIENIEEHLDQTDINPFLSDQIQKKDYRQVIRLHYLRLIQVLSENKLVKWKKDKTNYDYISELSNSSFQESFEELTLVYERVWYGEVVVEERDYEQVKPSFLTTISKAEGHINKEGRNE